MPGTSRFQISYVGGDGNDVVLTSQQPQTSVVTTLDDSGPGSLRDALQSAASGDTIDIQATGSVFLLGPLEIAQRELTILGPGAELFALEGGGVNSYRLFEIADGNNLILRDLAFADGWADDEGGAIGIGNATVLIERCAFVQNDANSLGGAIFLGSGNLTVRDCFFQHNTAGIDGGAIAGGPGSQINIENCTFVLGSAQGGGGIFNHGTLAVTNSTFTQNSVTSGGGAILNLGSAVLTHCTITENSADLAGGGLRSNGGTIQLRNCIVAQNTAPNGPDLSETTATGIVSGGTNLIGISGAGIIDGIGQDRTGTEGAPLDPRLQPLEESGSFVPIMLPETDSPAIDAGSNFGIATDQRGHRREFDHPDHPNGPTGDTTDIGAVERDLLSYDEWTRIHFTSAQLADLAVSGPEADPNSDGTPNQNHFVFNSDPVSDSIEGGALPTRRIDFDPTEPHERYLVLSHRLAPYLNS